MEPQALRRALGVREAVALGVGGTIGGGIFVLLGGAAGLAGPGALLAFLLAFISALLIALPYAELASRYPQAGGGYAFARAVLGRAWGFVMGWGYWGAYIFISGYVTLGFGGYLHDLTGLDPIVGALLLITTCAGVNYAGIRPSGRVQTIVVLLALASLVGFGLVGLPQIRSDYLQPFLPKGASGVLQASLLAFLAFGGFDMVAAAGEEVEHPRRNLPLAILATLMIVLVIYLLVTYVAIGILPWQMLGASSAPMADAAEAFVGPIGRRLVAGAAVLTTAATTNAVLVTTSRISFAMARDGLLPKGLARVHPLTGAPIVAVLINSALLGLVALAGSIQLAARVGGFLYVSQFALALIVLFLLRHRGERSPAFETPLPFVVLPLALGACVILLASSGLAGVIGGGVWLLTGLLVFQRRLSSSTG
jgi:APA family basic amino acid/polyamine antiporter